MQVDAGGIYLVNDADSALAGPLTGLGRLSNSQCALNGPGTGVINSQNTSTVSLSITFNAAFTGVKNIYMFAEDYNGNNSGFQARGTFTVAVAPGPTVDAVTPASGTGRTQVFTAVYSDPAGASTMDWRVLLINSALVGANSCGIKVDATGIYLVKDDNSDFLPGPLTNTGTVSNSQCTVNGSGSSVQNSGTHSTVTLSITFLPAFAGAKNIYMFANDTAGHSSDYVQRGTYTVAMGATSDSLSPSTGTGSSQVFTAVYSDVSGVSALRTRQLLITPASAGLTGLASCLVYVDSSGSYLANDANLHAAFGSGWAGSVSVGGGMDGICGTEYGSANGYRAD